MIFFEILLVYLLYIIIGYFFLFFEKVITNDFDEYRNVFNFRKDDFLTILIFWPIRYLVFLLIGCRYLFINVHEIFIINFGSFVINYLKELIEIFRNGGVNEK